MMKLYVLLVSFLVSCVSSYPYKDYPHIVQYSLEAYKPITQPKMLFKKLCFMVGREKVLELHLDAARFATVRENLNAFLNDTYEHDECLSFQDMGLHNGWTFHFDCRGYLECSTDSGEMINVGYNSDLIMGRTETIETPDAIALFGVFHVIDMKTFLTEKEIGSLKKAFDKVFGYK